MANADETHFDSYREQTKLKHQILVDYLPAYYNVLKSNHRNLVYVDGFAGRGDYVEAEKSFPGSPLLAMQLFAASNDHRSRVKCFFIEDDAGYAGALDAAVTAQQNAAPLAKAPVVFPGRFADFMTQLRAHLAKGGGLAPTFLFVDPCGVDGVNFSDLAEVLSREYCELFLFFNYEGINRIAGNAEKQGSSPTLVALFGSDERVQELTRLLRAAVSPRQREEVIVSQFCKALREAAGARFLLPFRIEHETKEKTSHYLLHATKHPHGFRIMKSVMGKAARQRGGTGGLELLQASNTAAPQLFEHPDATQVRKNILTELAQGHRKVSVFRKDWVSRPTDMFSEEDYKRVLLELEDTGKVLVFDKDNDKAKPASKRGRCDSKTGVVQTTLGDDCWLHLSPPGTQTP